jgi:serine protease Do
MLGMGLVYGQAPIPHHAWAPVAAMTSPAVARDDPMALLRGETAYGFEPDVCAMQLIFDQAASLPETLAVRLGPWSPTVGERVLAVGYPQLLPSEVTPQQQRMLVSDGLYGAYGTVTAVGNEGDDVNRRRRIRVEADWPLGMSGGPVFNEAGEVVAIVSTGIDPTVEHKGIAFAVSMGLLPELNAMLPSLIPGKPGWRRAYAVLRDEPWHLEGVSSFLEEAQTAATRLGSAYRVVFGEHQIGTDNFISAHG